MQGVGGGGGVWVSANEYSCAHHVTWSPNKLWSSTSIFNLWSDQNICTVSRLRRGQAREYWMIYSGPGFLIVIYFGSSPTPSPHILSASCLSFSVFQCVTGWGRERGKGGGEESIIRRRQPGPLWIILYSLVQTVALTAFGTVSPGIQST